jgi:hypothetical protein
MEIRKQTLTGGETITLDIKRKSGLTNDNESRKMLMNFVETKASKKFDILRIPPDSDPGNTTRSESSNRLPPRQYGSRNEQSSPPSPR